jgi:hypothetical protein
LTAVTGDGALWADARPVPEFIPAPPPVTKGLRGAPDRPGREWVFIARNPWLPANVRLPSVRLNVNPCRAAPEPSRIGILCTFAHRTDS